MEKQDSMNDLTNKCASIIKEGRAEILVKEKDVFYNPVQEFNRDLRFVKLYTYERILNIK